MIKMEMDLALLTDEQLREMLQHAAKEAIQIQDAVNLSGVVFTWAQVMDLICELSHRGNKGTAWKNEHPINVAFASKVASLTNCEFNSDAFDACRALAA